MNSFHRRTRREQREYHLLFQNSWAATPLLIVFLGVHCALGGKRSYAVSNFSNVAPSFSSGFTFSFSSSSSIKGGVCGAERSSSIASFQSTVPCPGHKCESITPALS